MLLTCVAIARCQRVRIALTRRVIPTVIRHLLLALLDDLERLLHQRHLLHIVLTLLRVLDCTHHVIAFRHARLHRQVLDLLEHRLLAVLVHDHRFLLPETVVHRLRDELLGAGGVGVVGGDLRRAGFLDSEALALGAYARLLDVRCFDVLHRLLLLDLDRR